MQILKYLATALVTVGALGVGCAVAQAAPAQNSADILSGTLGATTCGDFTKMDQTAQADFMKQIGQSGSDSSLTSNSGVGNTSGDGQMNSMKSSGDAAGSTAGSLGLGAPLTAGQLVAACQAASPTSTLHDAFAQFSSGANSTANGVSK